MKHRQDRFAILQGVEPGGGARLACHARPCPPHHWVIDSPSGNNLSDAACKKCGGRRRYRNWLEQYEYSGLTWDND